MTIHEFKPSAIDLCVEDASKKVFARIRLGEAKKSTANADLTYSPLAPAVDVAPTNDCRRARAAAPPARRPSHACESTGVPAITTPFALRHRLERPTNREDVFTFDLLDVGRE